MNVSVIALGGLFILGLILVAGLLFALPIMLLFNSIVLERLPEGVAPLSFWDAWGLGILTGLLFKSYSSNGNNA